MLDDYVDRQELNAFMQDLKRDSVEDAQRMQRYQMIGDVLRDDLNTASFMDISAAVHRAVDQQPALNGPPKARRAVFFGVSNWVRPLTGMAIAASVAMVTVVSFRTVEMNSVDHSAQTLAEVKVEFNSPAIVPVNPLIASQLRLTSTQVKIKTQRQAKQLSDYMMRHTGYAGQSTMQGMMPYVRVVGFETYPQKPVVHK
jgi:sigma-E factor negative regulatory protein RseA